jgi:hypothetical protein
VAREAAAILRAPLLAAELVWHDVEDGVLVTRHAAGSSWQLLLAAGQINSRTFGVAGQVLRRLHAGIPSGERLVHHAFLPENILVGRANRLCLLGWGGAGSGKPESDVVPFLARLLVDMTARPYTEDWYIDAGRAFLAGYEWHDRIGLAPMVGNEVLRLLEDRPDVPVAAGVRPVHLRSLGEDLLTGCARLPW